MSTTSMTRSSDFTNSAGLWQNNLHKYLQYLQNTRHLDAVQKFRMPSGISAMLSGRTNACTSSGLTKSCTAQAGCAGLEAEQIMHPNVNLK